MSKPHATFFKMLSARSRVRILQVLQERGEMSVDDLAAHLQIAVPTASRHLQLLRMHDLVSFRQEGQNRFYSANPEEIGLRIASFLDDLGIQLPRSTRPVGRPSRR